MQVSNKIFVVCLKSDLIAKEWAARGAKPVPDESRFVLATGRPAAGDQDVLRVGKVEVNQERGITKFATESLLMEFKDPQPARVVKEVAGSGVVYVEPIERGATQDWTWIVHLEPRVDPDVKAVEISQHADVISAEPDSTHLVKKRSRPPFH